MWGVFLMASKIQSFGRARIFTPPWLMTFSSLRKAASLILRQSCDISLWLCLSICHLQLLSKLYFGAATRIRGIGKWLCCRRQPSSHLSLLTLLPVLVCQKIASCHRFYLPGPKICSVKFEESLDFSLPTGSTEAPCRVVEIQFKRKVCDEQSRQRPISVWPALMLSSPQPPFWIWVAGSCCWCFPHQSQCQ